MKTFVNGPSRTFTAAVAGDLAGKENHLVELAAADDQVQLHSNAANLAVGVLQQRLEGGADWEVRLLGKGGTSKFVAAGVIERGARFKGDGTGKVITLGASGRSLGIALQKANAAGDVFEAIDVIEVIA